MGGAFGPIQAISDFIYLISAVISSDFRANRSLSDPSAVALSAILPTQPHNMACSSKEAKDSSFTPLESTEPEAGEGSWTTVGYRGAPNRTHPLYKKLSIISGQVNARTVAEVKAQLQEFGLCKR